MSKYLVRATYSADAFKGMINNPHDRENAIMSLVGALGIRVDPLYFSPSTAEAIMVIESDSQKNASLMMVVLSSGSLLDASVIDLISSAEMKAAMETGKELASQYKAANS